MTDSDWPAGPVIVVSDDEARAAVLAAHFPDAYLTRPGADRVSPPGAPRASRLVVLAGADAGRALTELAPRLAGDATLLVESTGDSEPPIAGWHPLRRLDADGFRLVELGRGDAPTAADATSPVTTDGADASTATATGPAASGDGTPPVTAAGQAAQATTSVPAPAAEAPTVPAPGSTSRRSRFLALGAVAALAAIAAAVVVALVTTTGYVGFAVTILALAALGGGAGLAWLQSRSARQVQQALRRQREKDRAARTKAQKQLAVATSSMQERTRALDERLALLEQELHVVSASTLETARRLPETRTPEMFTDPHELTAMHQTQAVANLFALVPVRGVIPFMGGWAASPDLVLTLVGEVLTRRPALVVECGSGVSTLWLSLVIDHFGLETRVVSLDHDPVYAEQTRQTLRDHGVAHVAEVRDAPLAPTGLPGHDTPWYALESIEDLHDIGLLFVDGPPDATGPLVRLPAVPLLKDRLAPRASVVLDDVVRAAEQEVMSRWAAILPDFTLTRLSLQKDASRFRRG
ncbi:class I SAM-dependent methyltransferase [Terrabacter sp. MAHUQ-38]|uniref:class I SAM-dependent methyltransferase n=1 Tax=unclassified Terrabacter TaxID=2630222 RepID=UPI00165DB65D|nr:class I SAM-dependent methyltransferase [Terrabacter sp. MAHUQ-38]